MYKKKMDPALQLRRVSRAVQRRYWKTKRSTHIYRTLEHRRIAGRFPFLEQWEEKQTQAEKALRERHEVYTTEVSSPGMAISLETASFLKVFCEGIEPRRILDLGSGFSSFVFCSYAASQPGTVVWSVDDNAEWLERTGIYLAHEGLPTEDLLLWTAVEQPLPINDTVDLVFLDLGRNLRQKALGLVMSLVQQRGFAILDDMHRPGYGQVVRETARHHECYYTDLISYTLDERGRFCGLAVSRHAPMGES